MTTTTIKLETNTKEKFDNFQRSLGVKLKTKVTQDISIDILLNTFKDFTRLNNELKRAKGQK